MKKALIGIIATVALAIPAMAAPHAASSAKQRIKFVRIARNLELNPLAFNAVQQRQWATEFIVNARDLHLELCEPVLSPLKASDQNYNNQLSMQFMVSSAAFMLEHPKVKDPVKIQTAGVEGTLKAYESILKVDRNAHFDFLDGLMEQKKSGQLETYVASVSSGCGRLSEHAPAKHRLIP